MLHSCSTVGNVKLVFCILYLSAGYINPFHRCLSKICRKYTKEKYCSFAIKLRLCNKVLAETISTSVIHNKRPDRAGNLSKLFMEVRSFVLDSTVGAFYSLKRTFVTIFPLKTFSTRFRH